MITIQKNANVSGYCPFLDEEVTIKAVFVSSESTVSQRYAIQDKNLCQNTDECNIDPRRCPVYDQEHLWNEL